MPTDHPLDHAARASLLGPHARFAQRRGRVLRYHPDVAGFLALPDDPDLDDWRDAAELVGPGADLAVSGSDLVAPPGWTELLRGAGVQLVDDGVETAADPEAVAL